MSIFSFQVYQDEYEEGEHGEFTVRDDKYWTIKWFHPRKTKDGITMSEDGEILDLRKFELFISRIRNGINCAYRRDNEDIFEYNENTFRINPDTCQTGLNFDSSLVDFRITGHKEELLSTLQKIYDWLQSVVVQNTLIENNL